MGAIIDQGQLDTIDGYVQSAIKKAQKSLLVVKLRNLKAMKMVSGMSRRLLLTSITI